MLRVLQGITDYVCVDALGKLYAPIPTEVMLVSCLVVLVAMWQSVHTVMYLLHLTEVESWCVITVVMRNEKSEFARNVVRNT